MVPFVSIIMPAYNAEKYIREAIDSVLAQTYTSFEFVIVDDCSTDGTWEIISEYAQKNKNIKAVRNEKNMKIVKTRNRGFSLCDPNAKYFVIFDSDDICFKDRLERQVAFLEKNEDYALIGSSTTIIDEAGKEVGFRKYPVTNGEIQKAIILYDPIAQPSVMIRASALRDDLGFYNERYTRCQDYELWFRIAQKYKIKNFSKPVIKYRVSSTQGKVKHLKTTLKFTIEIQKRWLFTKKYFSIFALAKWCLLGIMVLFPSSFILFFFKKYVYGV